MKNMARTGKELENRLLYSHLDAGWRNNVIAALQPPNRYPSSRAMRATISG
jgi:hypothetical protein